MNWVLFAPTLLVVVGALATLGSEPFLKQTADKHRVLPWTASIFLLLAGIAVYPQLSLTGAVDVHGLYAFDAIRGWLELAVIAAGFFGIVGLQKSLTRDEFAGGEPYALMLLATVGALLMVHANDTIGLYVGVELASLSIYALVGTRRHRADSNEGLFKYYAMGAVFSAVLLYGAALTYGATGGTRFGLPILEGRDALFAFGQILITIGLLFKVGAFPFHFWAPDAYVAAPLPVTGFMAAVMKIGGFAGLGMVWLNALVVGSQLPLDGAVWAGLSLQSLTELPDYLARGGVILLAVAVLSLLLGNFSALGQRSARRIMAFSSIAHAGYVLIAFATPTAESANFDLQAAWYYLVAYAVASAALLSAIAMMAGDEDADDLETLSGGARRHPLAGVVATIALVSLAGVPDCWLHR